MLPKIYPDDLLAERNGNDNSSVEYLDVQLRVCHDSLHTSVYHKVEHFPFNVILFTFPESLLPRKLGSCVFASQVLRYLRICSHLDYVIVKVKSTCKVFVDRGYFTSELRIGMEKLLRNHPFVLFKFGLRSGRQLSVLCGLC